MHESETSFGERLRRLRSAAALSQEALAERAGLSRNAISSLERGLHPTPHLATVRLLADGLGLPADDRVALLAAARPMLWQDVRTSRARPPQVALPTPLTRLIGREPEMAALQSTLRRGDSRLVTLTGAGGSGKTRLAVAVAAAMEDAFPDGAYFVDLSPLSAHELVIPTIAAVLGVRDIAGEQLTETLSRVFAPMRLLLLLDNCERVLDAAAGITTLLARSPGLTVLATGRRPFHVRGEREFPVAPLPLLATDGQWNIAEVAGNPAVALFVERVSEVQPNFALTNDNADVIAALCRRLDGMPLAIELAAARSKVLSPQALLTRLEPRLPLLAGGARDLPTRQRTMRDAIAWSHDLLEPEGQALFRRLAVFAGGFTLAAAEALADPTGAGPVLEGIGALADQSLLHIASGAGDEMRYRMLETVREFGLEQLAAAGEADEARQRHAEHFLQLTEDLTGGMPLLVNLRSLTRVAAEHDNVRSALTWFHEHDETDALLRLSASLYGLWLAHGRYREGLYWLGEALERSSQTACAERVQALVASGMLAIFQGDYARSGEFGAEALTLARALGDPLLVGQALTVTGFLALRQGAYDRAEVLLDEGYRHLSQVAAGEPRVLADTGTVLLILGNLDVIQAQFGRAAQRETAALEQFRIAGNDWGVGEALSAMGVIFYCTGDYERAAAYYAEGLRYVRRLGHPLMVASELTGLAGVAAAIGQPEKGARLLGAAEAIRSSLDAPMAPRDQPVLERAIAALTTALGSERLSAAREAGRELNLDAAVAEAEAIAEAILRSG